jgi:cytoskeletal protein CcmA (bactofilin family)
MTLNVGADVGGAVANVNGRIALKDAHVAGGLRTADGDIEVLGGSRVEGGIIVKRGNSGLFSFSSHKPHVVIGPGAVVQGDLRFERAVDLYVSDSATTGPITGASAIRFSGPSPPG